MPDSAKTYKTIAVCGHNHYGFAGAITAGFEAVDGIDTTAVTYDHIPYAKARSRSIFRRLRYAKKSNRLNAHALATIDAAAPDLVVVIEGSCLTPETVTQMRAKRTVVLWSIDSLCRLKLDTELLGAYDQVFCFEPNDREIWPDMEYLPIGYDERIYHPLADASKTHDLVWVGSAHSDRLDRLNQVSAAALEHGFSFGIFGPTCKEKHLNEFKEKYPSMGQCLRINAPISPEQANEIYNSSRLALNLHAVNPWEKNFNPRTWEAAAAGAPTLTDWKESMQGHVVDGKNAFVFDDIKDVGPRMEEILNDPDALAAARTQGITDASTKHTFQQRCETMLSILTEKKDKHV